MVCQTHLGILATDLLKSLAYKMQLQKSQFMYQKYLRSTEKFLDRSTSQNLTKEPNIRKYFAIRFCQVGKSSAPLPISLMKWTLTSQTSLNIQKCYQEKTTLLLLFQILLTCRIMNIKLKIFIMSDSLFIFSRLAERRHI